MLDCGITCWQNCPELPFHQQIDELSTFCHDVNVLTSANKFANLPSLGINFHEKFCLIGSEKSYAWGTARHLLGICSPRLVWHQDPLFIVAPYC